MNWGDVREWDPAGLDTVVDDMQAATRNVQRNADELAVAQPQQWRGEAATAARAKRRELVGEYADLENSAEPVWKALDAAAGEIRDLHREQDEIADLGARYHWQIDRSGSIVGNLPGVDQLDPDYARLRQQVRQQLSTRVSDVLSRATRIDGEIAAAMRRAHSPTLFTDSDGNTGRVNVPPAGTSPQEVNDWWNGLSESERAELIRTNPAAIGPLDGVPAEYRDQANRARLDGMRDRLETRLDDLRGQLAQVRGPGGGAERARLSNQIAEVEGKLSGLDDIQKKLDSTAGMPDSRRHYLLDVSTDNNGQAIVAKGNPDTASHVATYVPGTGAGLDGIGEDLNRGDDMHRSARHAGAKDTSVITWVGYDAPQNVVTEATRESYAANATADLGQFQDGLRATHQGHEASHNTLIGHSYGSTVIGHTAKDDGINLDVDKMVFVGSPGVGVDHVSELNTDPGNVYATTAENDIIRGTPRFIHERQPISDDFWNGTDNQTFASDPGTKGSWYAGGKSAAAHSEYWDPGNKALDNMGRIIAGQRPEGH